MILENIGTNWLAYIPFVMILILMVIGYFLVKTGWQFAKAEEDTDIPDSARSILRKSFVRKMITFAIVLTFAIFSMFFAYGSGKRVKTSDQPKSGWMERTETLPDEKPIAIIQSEGEANKDKTGTLPKVATEEEYRKSQEEADKAIAEMLKRSEERKNN